LKGRRAFDYLPAQFEEKRMQGCDWGKDWSMCEINSEILGGRCRGMYSVIIKREWS